MNLGALQSLFHGVISGEVAEDDARVQQAFVSDARLPAPARMHVYADMYLCRLVDALGAEFPMTAQLLGEHAFFALARDYVIAHPSEHPDIGQLGRLLAEFIRAGPKARGDLSELAELERVRSVAFGAADATAQTWDALAQLGPELFAGTRLTLVPSVRTMIARFDLTALWEALQHDAKPEPAPLAAPRTFAIWKKQLEVFHIALQPAEAAGLAAAMGGATLGDVCEAFAETEDPARLAFEAIAGWFNEGWVAAVLPPDA